MKYIALTFQFSYVTSVPKFNHCFLNELPLNLRRAAVLRLAKQKVCWSCCTDSTVYTVLKSANKATLILIPESKGMPFYELLRQ